MEEQFGFALNSTSNSLTLSFLPKEGLEGQYNFSVRISLYGALKNDDYNFTLIIKSACLLYPLLIAYPGLVPGYSY